MKEKTNRIGIRETLAIHRRAVKDMRHVAPGCFAPFLLCSIVKAASSYAAIWLSAQLINELASQRRLDVLGKWVGLILAVTAATELLKAVLER